MRTRGCPPNPLNCGACSSDMITSRFGAVPMVSLRAGVYQIDGGLRRAGGGEQGDEPAGRAGPCYHRRRVLLTVFLIGAIGGLLAGLLGVGGAVILLPLLTTFAGLSLKEAAGLTVVQVVASSLVSWWAFRRERLVHMPLAVTMGTGAAIGGLAGGAVSGHLPETALELIFLGAVLAALALLLLPPLDTPAPPDKMPHYNPFLAVGWGSWWGAWPGSWGRGAGSWWCPSCWA